MMSLHLSELSFFFTKQAFVSVPEMMPPFVIKIAHPFATIISK